jgi:hypothetical protein
MAISSPLWSMEEKDFQLLLKDVSDSIDSNKLDMLKNSDTQTYTADQAKRILISFSLGSNRVKGLEYLSTKIDDPENKMELIKAFADDLGSYKSAAYKIINGIKGNPSPSKKETQSSAVGKITLNTSNPACSAHLTFSDSVKLGYVGQGEFNTTKLKYWFSECKSNEVNSCVTPFFKYEFDIMPDWTQFQHENEIPLSTLMGEKNGITIPKRNQFYMVTLLTENKVLAKAESSIQN